ncbi:hypothetical protein SAMN05660297_01745 [Natronincola peptidivorans]|uniref:CAAX protease self-immunity n=1 Tax=Natronincola peptidivorans TaxID=426128 RepID=A0A1I0CSF6_9FIRM|nr:hypothetical protein [Natronincola peptidivorans]SET22732.1 hypothetical protein SAMN05660297_01745 [Natronincola peptidivorans]
MIVNIIMAGILAAAFAYLCNKIILKAFKEEGLTILVPLLEEMAKTTFALLLKTNIIGSHFIFGCIEGIYDIFTSSKKIGKWAAVASILSHSFFGIVTYFTYKKTNIPLIAIIVAWIFHSGWNWYVTKKL